MISLVLTCMGPDRPGLVGQLSDTVAAHGANWEECQMSRLAGQFVGILSLRVPGEQMDALMRALGHIEPIQITIQQSKEEPVATVSSTQMFQLQIEGRDQPGLLRDISKILLQKKIDLAGLKTMFHTSEPDSDSKASWFTAQASLSIPASFDISILQSALEGLSKDLQVTLQPA